MLTRDKLEYQKRLRFIREAKDSAKTSSPELELAKAQEESDLTKPVVTLGDSENKIPSRGETPKSYNEVPKTAETSRVKKPVEDAEKGDNILDVDLSDIDHAKIAESSIRQETAKDAKQRHELSTANTQKARLKNQSFAQRTQKESAHKSLEEVLRECGCEIKSPFDAPGHEPQGYMLVQNLQQLAQQTAELVDMADHHVNPEPWVESKVNSAAEHIDAVYDYINHGRKHREDMEHHDSEEMMEEGVMKVKQDELKKMIQEAVKAKLQELSTFNKEELPGSGDMPSLMEDFDELLLDFSKKALDLHAKMVDEMKVDMLGGVASPQMSPRIGERNRMLTVRAGLLRKMAANCTAALEAVRREG